MPNHALYASTDSILGCEKHMSSHHYMVHEGRAYAWGQRGQLAAGTTYLLGISGCDAAGAVQLPVTTIPHMEFSVWVEGSYWGIRFIENAQWRRAAAPATAVVYSRNRVVTSMPKLYLHTNAEVTGAVPYGGQTLFATYVGGSSGVAGAIGAGTSEDRDEWPLSPALLRVVPPLNPAAVAANGYLFELTNNTAALGRYVISMNWYEVDNS